MKKIDLKNYKYPDRFGESLGYKVVRADLKNHRAETVLKIREDHLSPAERVHGGVIAAFFDFSLGAAVFTTLGPYDYCSTIELKVNYLRPLLLEDFLRSKTEVIFRGKKLCVVRGLIYRKGDRAPVAMASATFNIVPGAIPQKGATGIPRTPKARSK